MLVAGASALRTPEAEVAELADATDSKSVSSEEEWGFDSPLRHSVSLGRTP